MQVQLMNLLAEAVLHEMNLKIALTIELDRGPIGSEMLLQESVRF